MHTLTDMRLRATAALALFSFVFFGGEFCFDTSIGAFVDSAQVIWAQNVGLAISAVGFIAFGLLTRTTLRKHLRTITVIGTLAASACLLGVELGTSKAIVLATGYAACFMLGGAGAGAHWQVARTMGASGALARVVGIAYASGILLQFLNNQLVPEGAAEAAVLSAGCVAMAAIAFSMRKVESEDAPHTGEAGFTVSSTSRAKPAAAHKSESGNAPEQAAPCEKQHANASRNPAPPQEPNAANSARPQPLKNALWLCALVMLLACQFSTLDNVVTMADALGIVNVEEWPRLFLAASGIAAGFIFDLEKRRYMGLVMFCVALLSTCTILAVEAGLGQLTGLIAYYIGTGFYTVFFTTTFLTLAQHMRTPALWAGMGHAVNSTCALLFSAVSLALVQTGNTALTMMGAVLLFALVIVASAGSGLMSLPEGEPPNATARAIAPTPAPEPPAPAVPELTEEQHLATFAKRYALTARETDVLHAVSADDRPLKQVADDMGISLRMVQRHLTSLYQKTDTQSRTGLVMKYLEER